MFIFTFFLVVIVSQFVTNRILNISDDNSVGYSYSKKHTFILLGFLLLGILFQKLAFLKEKPKIYWIVCGSYAFAILLTMVIFATIKKVILVKQREEIQAVFAVLEPVIPNEAKVKNKETQEFEMRDINKPPFKLGYEDNKINRITIKINPNTFKETVAVNLCLSLNKYLPNYEWVNEFDFAARECSFVGTPLPPSVARYQGSWLRPTEFIPIGLSGLGEVSWTINSIKDTGKSNYIYDDGKLAKTVDTPSAPQALCVGSPLGLDTVIPTTTGYKTMQTIKVGDKVFGYENKPVEVAAVFDINQNPEEVYELIFSYELNEIKVISDGVHRFPVITSDQKDNNFHEVHCKDLAIGQTIMGNDKNYVLSKKTLIKSQPVRCIRVNSDEHIFLITDVRDVNWNGGKCYPFKAVYTYNTGGGKAITLEQEIEVIAHQE